MTHLEWPHWLYHHQNFVSVGHVTEGSEGHSSGGMYYIVYVAMILPLFDDCSTVWNRCGKMNSDYLDRLQRRAVSSIEGRKVQQCHVNLTLSSPSLESRRCYQIYLQVYKCLNDLAPTYLLEEFKLSSDFHTHNTRHKDQVRLPLAKTTKIPKLV